MLKYGYHGIRGLIAVLETEDKERFWQTYMASVLYCVAKGILSNFSMPSYVDLVNSNSQPVDNRSAKEIKDHILNKLNKKLGRR